MTEAREQENVRSWYAEGGGVMIDMRLCKVYQTTEGQSTTVTLQGGVFVSDAWELSPLELLVTDFRVRSPAFKNGFWVKTINRGSILQQIDLIDLDGINDWNNGNLAGKFAKKLSKM